VYFPAAEIAGPHSRRGHQAVLIEVIAPVLGLDLGEPEGSTLAVKVGTRDDCLTLTRHSARDGCLGGGHTCKEDRD